MTDNDDYDLSELDEQHEREVASSFLWGLAIGFLAGGLLSLLVSLSL